MNDSTPEAYNTTSSLKRRLEVLARGGEINRLIDQAQEATNGGINRIRARRHVRAFIRGRNWTASRFHAPVPEIEIGGPQHEDELNIEAFATADPNKIYLNPLSLKKLSSANYPDNSLNLEEIGPMTPEQIYEFAGIGGTVHFLQFKGAPELLNFEAGMSSASDDYATYRQHPLEREEARIAGEYFQKKYGYNPLKRLPS